MYLRFVVEKPFVPGNIFLKSSLNVSKNALPHLLSACFQQYPYQVKSSILEKGKHVVPKAASNNFLYFTIPYFVMV